MSSVAMYADATCALMRLRDGYRELVRADRRLDGLVAIIVRSVILGASLSSAVKLLEVEYASLKRLVLKVKVLEFHAYRKLALIGEHV